MNGRQRPLAAFSLRRVDQSLELFLTQQFLGQRRIRVVERLIRKIVAGPVKPFGDGDLMLDQSGFFNRSKNRKLAGLPLLSGATPASLIDGQTDQNGHHE